MHAEKICSFSTCVECSLYPQSLLALTFCAAPISRYVHNNIFFSFAVDADLEQLSRKRIADNNLKSDSISSVSNSSEKTSTNKLPFSAARVHSGDKSNDTSTEDIGCAMDSASDVRSETQLAESEQATYASANNDLKGTKAYQEVDVSGLYNLAMAIIDYRGHRVVAQVRINLKYYFSSFLK